MKIEGIEPVEILHKLIELKAPKQAFENEIQLKPTQAQGLAIPQKAPAKQLNTHIHQLIQHPLLENYKLKQQDVLVLADLWQCHIEFPGRSISWESICFSAKIDCYKLTECLEYLTMLLMQNIICFDDKIAGNYYLNPSILLFAKYKLSNDIILRILGRDINKELGLIMKETWQNDGDFLSDLRLVFDVCYYSFAKINSRYPVLEYPILSACLHLLKERILAAPDTLEIKALVQKHSLCENQLFIILMVMYHQLCGDDRITEADLILSLEPDPRLRYLQQELLRDDSILVSMGLINRELRFHRAQVSSLGITPQIMKSLGGKTQKSEPISKNLSPFFQRSKPSQALDDLILPATDKQLIYQILAKCKSGIRKDLQKWGFKLENHKQGLVLLLYGAPGTGKTYTAGAIATELHKDLITINVSELRNKFYGETEKLIKKAFAEMREMAKEEENSPVLLLNEADQLIHERISNTSTSSAVENSIQSIILEELETFPGILILTTNLESNLDEAFFRRFDLKFGFRLPNLESRRKLWKLYLRKEIPGSADIDVEPLAQKYQFSGAQIALVIQNACIEAISRKGKSKRLGLQDLQKYADLEQPWTNQVNKTIGF